MGTGRESRFMDPGQGWTACSLCGRIPSGPPMVLSVHFPLCLCPSCASWELRVCLHCGGVERIRPSRAAAPHVRLSAGCLACGDGDPATQRYSDRRREHLLRHFAPRLDAMRRKSALRLSDRSPVRHLLNSWSELPWSI